MDESSGSAPGHPPPAADDPALPGAPALPAPFPEPLLAFVETVAFDAPAEDVSLGEALCDMPLSGAVPDGDAVADPVDVGLLKGEAPPGMDVALDGLFVGSVDGSDGAFVEETPGVGGFGVCAMAEALERNSTTDTVAIMDGRIRFLPVAGVRLPGRIGCSLTKA